MSVVRAVLEELPFLLVAHFVVNKAKTFKTIATQA